MIKLFADWFTFKLLKLTAHTLLAEAVNFFVFDIIKIFLMISVIIFTVAVIRTYLPPHKIRNILAHKKRFLGHITAGILGIFTPFCTCSAIPLFLGFIEAGVPLGVTFTFLVSSPMINEVALVLLLGMFGVKVAILYIASGFIIAMISGLYIGSIHPDRLLEKVAQQAQSGTMFAQVDFKWNDRIAYAKGYTLGIIKEVWPYIVIGIGVGAWIHGYVPTDFLARYAGAGKWYAVPVAVLIGIPLYGSCAGAIPLMGALVEKGVSLGTGLAFMMAVTGLSMPEFMILRKIMKIRLIVIFASVVGLGIIFTGYLFNFVLR